MRQLKMLKKSVEQAITEPSIYASNSSVDETQTPEAENAPAVGETESKSTNDVPKLVKENEGEPSAELHKNDENIKVENTEDVAEDEGQVVASVNEEPRNNIEDKEAEVEVEKTNNADKVDTPVEVNTSEEVAETTEVENDANDQENKSEQEQNELEQQQQQQVEDQVEAGEDDAVTDDSDLAEPIEVVIIDDPSVNAAKSTMNKPTVATVVDEVIA